ASQGGMCAVINSSCCSYIDQSKRIETDIKQIWQQAQLLHQVSQDDTSWGFSELWEKLTSWLPNFTWLKQLFMAVIMLIILGMLICCILQCFMWMYKRTGNTYEEWKKHKLRQNIESGKYFTKT
ncbi:Endogenous retrovirus group V member 2 Env polyprotein, partial [Eudyptes chrysolophus]